NNARYWKIGITLADVDIARKRLLAMGVEVSEAKQFLDVGYLCHLNDPDGYCIELLQYDFAQHHKALVSDSSYKLGCAPTLGQITLRISDPESSLHFYQDVLGLRLLSRQVIEPHQFTLYFLACTDELPPNPNIDAVENREWLWQRPYTTLELQHVWRTGWRGLVQRTDVDPGFRRISFATNALEKLVGRMVAEGIEVSEPGAFDSMLKATTTTALDPDGNAVRIVANG
ncbi:MAG: VOC family protein, partial [Pseudomonadales bacterium]